ncbi:MAG: alpha-hydroxy-acid oxidizing protein [Spirochaetes bacterium]|nr:alpha-hydroxy-acid oxidizing protein [Spirochaetota bacterium]
MVSSKRLMIIGAGVLQVPVIEIAKQMGLKTIVTDYNKDAPGLKIADVPLIMSTKDMEGNVRLAKQYAFKDGIDGVITVGTDAAMTVAAVANALNLPGIKFEAAEGATNKIKMRNKLKKQNVPIPDFNECWSVEDAYRFATTHKFPFVIKPSDNMGARGVIKIDDVDEIQEKFDHAKKYSPSGEVIIEEYMDGLELSIDALLFNGKIHITGIADRMIDLEPFFVEIGHIMPSELPQAKQQEAVDVFKRGIKALGLSLGAAKGDIKITSKGAMIGEIAARLSGGFMSAYTYPLSTGVNLIKAAIKIALGQKVTENELRPKFQKVAVEKAIIPQVGLVLGVSGIEEAKKIPGIAEIFLRVRTGDIFHSPTSNVEKAGNVIGVAKNRKDCLKIVDKALKMIKVEVGPTPHITEEEIRLKAQRLFKGSCFACEDCDGKSCAGLIPGMGAVGKGNAFKANMESFKKYRINTRVIHNVSAPDLSIKIFGYKLAIPIIAAPITGTDVNMNNAMDELEYDRIVVNAFRDLGSIAMVGDGADPEQYLIGLKSIEEADGWGIPIFKPRSDQKQVIKRIQEAQSIGCLATGCDVDAARFVTMKLKNQSVSPKSKKDLEELSHCTKLPFIVKGIMDKEDAIQAVEAGAKAIIVSNHGGRVMDDMPGTLDVLPQIAQSVKQKCLIMADGGIRNGRDVFKCLSLGADAVLLGRPVAIAAVGGGLDGIKLFVNKIVQELIEVMILTGSKNIAKINPSRVIEV